MGISFRPMRNLKAFMKRRGLTQARLAELMGVSQPTVWHWLNGTKHPSPENFCKLADLTGMTTDELFDRKRA